MAIGTGENILKPFKTQEVLDLEAKLKVAVEALERVTETESTDGWEMQNIADAALKKVRK